MIRKIINVLNQCDNNFAFMAGVSFTSLLINASECVEYHVYVLALGMSRENQDKFYEVIWGYPHIDMMLEVISLPFSYELSLCYCGNGILLSSDMERFSSRGEMQAVC